jgi:predicted GNAT family acetyltransferase
MPTDAGADIVRTNVEHDEERSRYELEVDGRFVGVADYRDEGDVLVFTHTQIARHLRGQGLGAILIGAALDDVRQSGRTVVPQCWYVGQFIDEHPEYADLVAA